MGEPRQAIGPVGRAPALATVSLVCLTLAGVADPQEAVNAPPLFGISSVLVKKNTLELVEDDGLPSGLDLWAAGHRVAKAAVAIGSTFEVTDKHHLGYSFTLISIHEGAATIRTTYWTAFPGREATRSTSTTVVRSYVTKRKGKP